MPHKGWIAMTMYKLTAPLKHYLWGGHKLSEKYGKTSDQIVAESWEISAHKDGPSQIRKNDTLLSRYQTCGNQILGTHGQDQQFFPVLVKLIDAKQPLSIQVHPNDDYALRVEKEYGKTEMWYIVEASPESYIYYGTKHKIDAETLKQSIEANTVLDYLNKVPVKAGDVIFVEAGTIHAIGPDIVICEIQQNSNTTYRLYDFDRRDKDGNYRELHIDKGVEVSNLEPLDTSFKPQGEPKIIDGNTVTLLVECDYFTTHRIDLKSTLKIPNNPYSFIGIVCLKGEVCVDGLHPFELKRGESGMIEANAGNITLTGDAELIVVTL